MLGRTLWAKIAAIVFYIIYTIMHAIRIVRSLRWDANWKITSAEGESTKILWMQLASKKKKIADSIANDHKRLTWSGWPSLFCNVTDGVSVLCDIISCMLITALPMNL